MGIFVASKGMYATDENIDAFKSLYDRMVDLFLKITIGGIDNLCAMNIHHVESSSMDDWRNCNHAGGKCTRCGYMFEYSYGGKKLNVRVTPNGEYIEDGVIREVDDDS